MPVQTTTSVLAGKLKNKTSQTFLANREKPPVINAMGDLPPGINGIAKLVKCGFQLVKEGSANSGKPMFRAEGIIVSPDKAPNGELVKGRRTSTMEMCFDTKTTSREVSEDEHYQNVMNTLKCLGADCSQVEKYSDLEPIALALQDADVYFTFTTSQGKEQPGKPARVWENWGSFIEYAEDPTAGPGSVEDNSGAADDQAPADEPADEPAADEPAEDEDLDALAKAADAKKDSEAKEKAGQRLEAIAAEKGLDADEVGNAANWAAVVEMIRAADTSAEEPVDEPAADEVYEPTKGDVIKYKLVDPKDKKKSKTVEGEIVLVDKKKSAVTLKLVDTGKMLMSADGKTARLVPFGELIAQ